MKKLAAIADRRRRSRGRRRHRHRLTREDRLDGAEEHRPDGASRPGSSRPSSRCVKQAGLAGTLSGKGPLTVFAPDRRRVRQGAEGDPRTRSPRTRPSSSAVLLYHVAKGKLTAAKVVKRKSIKTLNGQSLRVRVAAARSTSAAPASPRPTSWPPTASSTSSTRSSFRRRCKAEAVGGPARRNTPAGPPPRRASCSPVFRLVRVWHRRRWPGESSSSAATCESTTTLRSQPQPSASRRSFHSSCSTTGCSEARTERRSCSSRSPTYGNRSAASSSCVTATPLRRSCGWAPRRSS